MLPVVAGALSGAEAAIEKRKTLRLSGFLCSVPQILLKQEPRRRQPKAKGKLVQLIKKLLKGTLAAG